jgi:RNA 2',3'-cyclic 3'-phosphodiesterase
LSKKRLFIAIDLPEPIRAGLAQMQERFKRFVRDAKWVKPTGIHLTLKFLGYVDPEKIHEIGASLSYISGSFPAVSVSVQGCGFFPNPRRPNVVWAGVQSEELLVLQQEVENAMERLGFEKENRKFHPHLTLARLKNTRGTLPSLAEEAEKWKSKDLGHFTAQSFVLFESILKRDGAEYHKLQEFPLIGTTDEHR